MKQLTMVLAALLLAACGGTARDISVAAYGAYMDKPFDELGVWERLGGAEVMVIGEATQAERDYVAAAVRQLNGALPACARLTVGPHLRSWSLAQEVAPDGILKRVALHYGKIYVEFVTPAQRSHWAPGLGLAKQAGQSWGRYVQIVRHGHAPRKRVLVHEMTHSLGIKGHVPDTVDSLMVDGRAHGLPAGLSKSDKAVLRHLYPCTG